MHTDTVISHFVIWTSLSPLSYYNGSQRTQNKFKKKPAGRTRDITFTIPETLEIIGYPGSATSQNVIMAAYKIRLLTMHGTQKHKKYYL